MDILTPMLPAEPAYKHPRTLPGKMTEVATVLKPSLRQSFPTAAETQPIVMAFSIGAPRRRSTCSDTCSKQASRCSVGRRS
jgi:hypothetical protein